LVVLNLNDGENSIENRLELDGNHSVIPLSVDAQCDGEVMALSNPAYGVWAVQFHPESVLTPEGQQIINRWLELAKQYQVAL
jgi:anthranilate/para-aminobenzoate synthase component II